MEAKVAKLWVFAITATNVAIRMRKDMVIRQWTTNWPLSEIGMVINY